MIRIGGKADINEQRSCFAPDMAKFAKISMFDDLSSISSKSFSQPGLHVWYSPVSASHRRYKDFI